MKHFSLQELESLETLSSGHFDNLKLESKNCRIWLSRMTIEDGMPYNNQVTEEKLVEDGWVIVDQYKAV